MEADLEVTEGGGDGGGDTGKAGPTVPRSAQTVAIATFVALVARLALTYFFVKYGGDYEQPD